MELYGCEMQLSHVSVVTNRDNIFVGLLSSSQTYNCNPYMTQQRSRLGLITTAYYCLCQLLLLLFPFQSALAWQSDLTRSFSSYSKSYQNHHSNTMVRHMQSSKGPSTTSTAEWCPKQQIYVGGTVPGEISEAEMEAFLEKSDGKLHIFGYGSLCWKPGDDAILSDASVTRIFGRAIGWKRCWSQRSADHRGTPEFQGLVCTLLSDDEMNQLQGLPKSWKKPSGPTMTEGVVYTVPPNLVQECLQELDFREKGGYSRDIIQVQLEGNNTISALLYRGTPENPAFWKRPLMDLYFAAATMSVAVGPSGPNDAYLYNLDAFLSQTEQDMKKTTSSSSSNVIKRTSNNTGDVDTQALASMCRKLQTKSLFFLYGSGSNQYTQLNLSNQHQKYILSDDNNVHELAESVLVVPKLPGWYIESSAQHCPSQLYAGGGHSALLLNNGYLYLWGWNEFGQLGRSILLENEKKYMDPVLALPDISVEKAALGHTHTLILERTTGYVYGFGDNSRGQVTGSNNNDNNYNYENHSVKQLLQEESFVDIAAGLFHSAGITSDGELITWGCPRYAQCDDDMDSDFHRWMPEDGSKLIKVVCGRRHTVALDEHGRVWSMGDNKYGQLGRHSKERNEPQLVNGFLSQKGSGCLDIDCGWSHCLALVKDKDSDKTQLYGWGRNDKGQLGIPSTFHVIFPQSIQIGKDDDNEEEISININGFGCGAESSMILNTKDNSLWSCGWNEHGNLSSGETKDILEFTKIKGTRISPSTVHNTLDKNILFAVGGGHMLAMMI